LLNIAHIDGDGGTTDNGDLGGCGWKWKGGQHSKSWERTATIARRRDGRGRGGGDDTPTDNNDDDDDNDDDKDDNNGSNNNTTIKQCTVTLC
jgi:hypothetical protein